MGCSTSHPWAKTGGSMDSSDSSMKSYYRKRAPIYDRVYTYPERQRDLRFLEDYIPKQFTGLNVLEIAAGTGYWTQFIATQAKSILATDAVIESLTQIEKRPISKPVPIKVLDAYSLTEIPRKFNGAFAGLWLSHVPKQRLSEFIETLRQTLEPGATVLFVDNSTVQCERLPLSYTDEWGNTFQDRELEDGTIHRILKNFPAQVELIKAIGNFGSNPKYIQLENFWLFQYTAN
jgi:ubiquinone/menaquinone biosynthesis C-methylase UbiE